MRVTFDVLQETTSVDPQRILSGLLVTGLEVAVILLLCGAAYAVASLILSRFANARSEAIAAWRAAARVKTRRILLAAAAILTVAALAFNGWLLFQGIDS